MNQRSSITVENVPTELPAEETTTEPSIVYSDVPNASQRQSDHVGEPRRSDRVPKRPKYLKDYVSFGYTFCSAAYNTLGLLYSFILVFLYLTMYSDF